MEAGQKTIEKEHCSQEDFMRIFQKIFLRLSKSG